MQRVERALDEVTATTTSGAINIAGARRVVLFCERADHGSGSSEFSATVTAYDRKTRTALTYQTYSKWISNATNGNQQDLTRVASLTLSANGSDFLTMCPEDCFSKIKVTVTEDTDGTHSAWLIIDYGDGAAL